MDLSREQPIIDQEDTIAAISTAFGEGGIGIVRLSGADALAIAGRIFRRPGRDAADFVPENRRLTYGWIFDPATGRDVDEVLFCYMQAPHTYTCEDVVEIHCHGSVVSLREILALCLRAGARLAEKGEFTKRAFLNGRLDLSQAEAVMDLIGAKTEESLQLAVDQLDGRLSRAVGDLRTRLMDVLVNVSVNMDYPDEDIEPVLYEDLSKELDSFRNGVQRLLDSAVTGKVLREGLNVAILGRPNVGKSSLLNAMMGRERAIVTDIPGTTRDIIEEFINVGGIPVQLVDTAGIRRTEDTIEKIGIERSRDSANSADLVLLVIDGSESLTEEDRELLELVKGRRAIVLLNKQDLGQAVTEEQIREVLPEAVVLGSSFADAMTADIGPLSRAISDMVFSGKVVQEQSAVVTNVRHEEALSRALASLGDAIDLTAAGESLELIEIDARGAYEALGEILGETLQDDIIREIFARFCLGK